MSLRTAGLSAALIAALLITALAPCPSVEDGAAAQRAHGSAAPAGYAHSHRDEAGPDELALVQTCPCGCERAPIAGASPRLGPALPSALARVVPPIAAAPAPQRAPLVPGHFAPSTDHVPLPESA